MLPEEKEIGTENAVTVSTITEYSAGGARPAAERVQGAGGPNDDGLQ